jgi:hypothetical protein
MEFLRKKSEEQVTKVDSKKTNEEIMTELKLQWVDTTRASNIISALWETKECANYLIRKTMWVSAINFLRILNQKDRMEIAHMLNMYRQSWIITQNRELFDFLDVKELMIEMSQYQQYVEIWNLLTKTWKKIPTEATENMVKDLRWKMFLIQHIWDCESLSTAVVSTLFKEGEYALLAENLWKCHYLWDDEALTLIRKWFAKQVSEHLKSFTLLWSRVKNKLIKQWYQKEVSESPWTFKDDQHEYLWE